MVFCHRTANMSQGESSLTQGIQLPWGCEVVVGCWFGLVITFTQTLTKQPTSSWSFSFRPGAKSEIERVVAGAGTHPEPSQGALEQCTKPLRCSERPPMAAHTLWPRNSSGPNQQVLPGTQPRDRLWFYNQNKLHLWHLNSGTTAGSEFQIFIPGQVGGVELKVW